MFAVKHERRGNYFVLCEDGCGVCAELRFGKSEVRVPALFQAGGCRGKDKPGWNVDLGSV